MLELFLLFSRLPKTQRRRVAEQLVPLALPGPPRQKLVLATIAAEREVRREAEVERRLVEDAIKAGSIKDAAALAKFPALHAAYNRLPAGVQAGLFPAAPAAKQ